MIDLTKGQDAALSRGRVLVTERIIRTRDGRIVREDEPGVRGNLLYRVGDEVPVDEARKLGLIAEVPAAPTAEAAPEVPLGLTEERARGVVRLGGKKR